MDKVEYNSLHYIIALLKAYGINTIITSPGTQNSCFNYLVQEDEFFKCYSVLDERSAAYIASGIAYESQKPVVITCTGATASRNYLSAMTEAFYRKIPVIALTFIDEHSNRFSLSPQFLDRSISQNDVKTIDVSLPFIKDEADVQECLTMLNAAFVESVYYNNPVHIDSPSYFNFSPADELPSVWKTEYYDENFTIDRNELKGKSTAIFIGSHKRFTKDEENSISEFAVKNGIPVFCDNTSNYYGENKISTSKLCCMKRFKQCPNIIIDIGNVSGEYGFTSLFKNSKIWRISPDGKFRNRINKPLLKLFNCSELTFFKKMLSVDIEKQAYYEEIKNISDGIKIPELPLCNALVCQNMAKYIPQNSSLHIAILNSLRNSNFFEFDKSISLNCNVGGFGIDGPVSTLVGQSLNDENKLCFGIIGDTAFFYDMNVIGNRHVKNNLRIIVVNNRKCVEFRLKLHPCEQKIGDKADVLVAASNHNKGGAKGWAESCGFKYMSAHNKEEFLNQIQDFCQTESDKPILFEVFTTTEDEQNGLLEMQNFNKNKLEETLIKCYKTVKK